MYIPQPVLVTIILVIVLYLFAQGRDRKQERKNDGEVKWLRLRVEYLEDPAKFMERTKESILVNHRLMKKVYKDKSKEEIVEDLSEKSFRTSKAFAFIFSEEYGDQES